MGNYNRFRKILSQLESSGGKNIIHPMTSLGQPAGEFGIKPTTVQSLPQYLKNSGLEVPSELEALSKETDRAKITDAINSNKNGIADIVNDAALRLTFHRSGGDEQKAAYLWHQGLGANPNKMAENDYVKAYAKAIPSTNVESEERLASRAPQSTQENPEEINNKFQAMMKKFNVPQSDEEPKPIMVAQDDSLPKLKDMINSRRLR